MQVFHVCAHTDDGMVHKAFLCPEDTLFDQSIVKCNWWFYVDCAASPSIYDSNIPISKSYQLMKSLTYFSNFNKQVAKSDVNSNGRNDDWSSNNNDKESTDSQGLTLMEMESRLNAGRKVQEKDISQPNQVYNEQQNIDWEKQQIKINKIEKE